METRGAQQLNPVCWEGDASRDCPPSAGFAVTCLFSAVDQLAYTAQDLF